MRWRLVPCLIACVAMTALTSAQSRTADARSTETTLRGRVTAIDSGGPLRGVEVRARATNGRDNRLVTTDADGYFVISDLSPGEWQVTASKAGFISQQAGQERPFDAAQPLTLKAGTVDMSFALRRAGVIAGRIVDEFGEPLAGVKVQALRSKMQRGRRTLAPVGAGDQTDDNGTYRLYGLPPGEYYVGASLRLAPVENLVIDAAGSVPTYYPGVSSIGDAQRVILAAGDESSNVSFTVAHLRPVNVTGRVISASGEIVTDASIELVSTTDVNVNGIPIGYGGVVNGDGTFRIRNVTAGNYAVHCVYVKDGGQDIEQGYVPIIVGPGDVTDVVVPLVKAAIIDGVIAIEGTTSVAANPRWSVVAASTRDTHVETSVVMPETHRFRVRASGPTMLRVDQMPPNMMLKSIEIGGRDVADTVIDLPGGQTYDARVMLTDRLTELSGRVTTDRVPAARVPVVVFVDDPAKWVYGSRYVQVTRTDADGAFRLRALPPDSRYRAVALNYLDDDEQWDPDFLERVRAAASTVSIADGERKAIDLKVTTR
ncbi:MAG TPA: carboxypeptidase-like regulatory domain-containing protein [Vicinamibacterales bacterium]|nr:carboxypeptidase-like regulatory domain-containing protein [Vicinamibacterales bacterium]